MKWKHVVVFSLCLTLLGMVLSVSQVKSEKNVNVVLMVWDGVDRTVLFELLSEGSLPNVATLNVYNMTCNIEYDALTVTKPQHAMMLSGYLANVTGTTGNHLDAWTPLGNKSIFFRVKQLKPKYYVRGFITKPRNVAPILLSHSWKLQGKIEGIFWNKYGFNRVESYKTTIAPPKKALAKGEFARGTTRNVLRLAKLYPRFFYFFHIADPDEYGHTWGVNSKRYLKGIRDCDKLLGKLMETLPQETVFIVIGDHGFGTNGNEYKHLGCPYTFIASNWNLGNGYEVDVAPTIYEILGIDVMQFDPPLTGTSLVNEG